MIRINRLFAGGKKFLLLIPVVILIAFGFFFHYAIDQMNKAIFDEKLLEKEADVQMISNAVDELAATDKNWGSHYDLTAIRIQIETIDKEYHVYAAIFDSDHRLLTTQYSDPGVIPFDPFIFPGFVNAINGNNSGQIELPYYAEGKDMLLYYSWVPTYQVDVNRILLVVGLTVDSVISQPEQVLEIGMIAVMAFTFLVNIGFVALLLSFGKERKIDPQMVNQKPRTKKAT